MIVNGEEIPTNKQGYPLTEHFLAALLRGDPENIARAMEIVYDTAIENVEDYLKKVSRKTKIKMVTLWRKISQQEPPKKEKKRKAPPAPKVDDGPKIQYLTKLLEVCHDDPGFCVAVKKIILS